MDSSPDEIALLEAAATFAETNQYDREGFVSPQHEAAS